MGRFVKGQDPWNKGKKLSEEHRRKLSENNGRGMQGKKNPFSDEHIRKLRLSAIKRIEHTAGQVYPNYNPTACKRMDEYGKQYGYNFQHAENGGEFHIKELGYFVDGYDVEQNVVIEYDESRHYQDGKLRKKDIQRQKEIEEHLGCKFIRIRI